MYYKLIMRVTTFKFKIQKIISLFDKYYCVLGIREYNLRLKNAAEERYFSRKKIFETEKICEHYKRISCNQCKTGSTKENIFF